MLQLESGAGTGEGASCEVSVQEREKLVAYTWQASPFLACRL